MISLQLKGRSQQAKNQSEGIFGGGISGRSVLRNLFLRGIIYTFLGGSIITAVPSSGVSTTSNIPSAFPVKNFAFKIPFASAFNAAYFTLSGEISIPITDSKPLEQVILNRPEPQ